MRKAAQILQCVFRWKLILGAAIACAVAGVLMLRGCTSDPASKLLLHPIGNTDNPHRRGDVVFVHGLDGHHRLTWDSTTEPAFSWLDALSQQFPDVGFWSVEYPASSSEWYGSSMPIGDRAISMLEVYRLKSIGKRPLIFVTHSLGGLVTKQVFVNAVTLNEPKWQGIAEHTDGIVFLATPHAGSSIATYLDRLAKVLLTARSYRATVQAEELQRNSAMLRTLGNQFKRLADKNDVQILSFFENEGVGGVLPIVDQDSADIGMTDVITTGVDANHLTICKPSSRDDAVYLSVADFIQSTLFAPVENIDISVAAFLKQFNQAKQGGQDALLSFKDDYARKRMTWDVVVESRHPPQGDDPPFLIARAEANAPEKITAMFSPDKYPASLSPGTRITLSGTFDKGTNVLGVRLRDCELIRVHD